MSKLKMNTRDKILDKALEMFNERGIEYVGLRELAALLQIRVGNITYYFPTKDELVYQLSVELSKANAAIIVATDGMTLVGFLEIQHRVFQNQLHFRCLLLSFVHVMQQNKLVAAGYKKIQADRYQTIKTNFTVLVNAGYLAVKDEAEMDFLVSALALISRFWISEAAISFRQLTGEDQIRHYLVLITNLMLPYSTEKGRVDIGVFLEQFQEKIIV